MRRVNFTGSTRVGRIIEELAGKHLKRAVLERGGKAAMLVLRDAALDDAVDAAVFGAFMNQGQICMSTERIVVAGEVIDASVGDSGFGHFGSRAALEEFTELRWITILAGSRHHPI